MKNIFNLICTGMLATIVACTYNSEEELYPAPPGGCDTTGMSLTTDIQPIFSNYSCTSAGCHSTTTQAAGIDLQTYTKLQIWVNNELLIKSINHDGASPMPKGAPKMDQCDIDKVSAWINQGAKNN